MNLAVLGGLLTLLAAAVAVAYAQGSGYNLSWWTADGGGGGSSGAYTLSGTIGQADAGALTGGGYTLAGGFWQAGPNLNPFQPRAYLPLVRR